MNRKLLLIIVLIALAGTGLYTYRTVGSVEPTSTAEVQDAIREGLATLATPSAGPETSDTTGAKQPVVEFLLAVAHPEKQSVSAEDRRIAGALLTSDLAAQAKGDPGSLLTIPRPSRFTVSDPSSQGGLAVVSVEFKYSGKASRMVTFGLLRRDRSWKIQTIQVTPEAGRR